MSPSAKLAVFVELVDTPLACDAGELRFIFAYFGLIPTYHHVQTPKSRR